MLNNLFHKKQYATIKINKNKDRDENKNMTNETSNIHKKDNYKCDDQLWIKCKKCKEILYKEELKDNFNICSSCGYNFRISARERINLVLDKDSFCEFNDNFKSVNVLEFPQYNEKLKKAKNRSGIKEAVLTGKGSIKGIDCIVCVMDCNFMMGSMGAVVGEKITRAIEKAIEARLPIIVFTASGGARMQEGMISLMQMAKTSSALAKLSEQGILYLTVLTDPTTGGVTASFAMLGDIIIAEKGALIGFAGPRVIEQTIKKKLPEGFQKAEFLKNKGFVDKIVDRKNMRELLHNILFIHNGGDINE